MQSDKLCFARLPFDLALFSQSGFDPVLAISGRLAQNTSTIQFEHIPGCLIAMLSILPDWFHFQNEESRLTFTRLGRIPDCLHVPECTQFQICPFVIHSPDLLNSRLLQIAPDCIKFQIAFLVLHFSFPDWWDFQIVSNCQIGALSRLAYVRGARHTQAGLAAVMGGPAWLVGRGGWALTVAVIITAAVAVAAALGGSRSLPFRGMAGTVEYSTAARLIQFVFKKLPEYTETNEDGVGPELVNKPSDASPVHQSEEWQGP